MLSRTWVRRAIFYGALVLTLVVLRQRFFEDILAVVVGDNAAPGLASNLRAQTNGFILVFAIAVYLDFVTNWASEREESELAEVRNDIASLRQDLLSRMDPTELLERSVSGLIGGDESSKARLVRLIASNRPLITDLSCAYRLSYAPNTDKKRYILHSTETYTADVRSHVVAIANGSDNADAILDSGDDLTDFWTISADANEFVRLADEAAASVVVESMCIGSDGRQQKVRTSVKFDRPATQALVKKSPDLVGAVRVYRAEMPSGPAVHTIEATIQASTNDRYTYWVADRPTLVRSITFDVREIVLENPAQRFELLPFIAGTSFSAVDDRQVKDGTLTFRPNTWVLQGHGIVMIWK